MNEGIKNKDDFIGYEYKDITVAQDLEAMYADGYKNFGWNVESTSTPQIGIPSVTIKFKRNRKIRNKAELTRLQRQFDANVNEITSMEKSKIAYPSIMAYTIGVFGTAFMAGATFAYLGEQILLCIILSIPGFLGWIVPYFAYKSIYTKKSNTVTPLIEGKYDDVYEVCEKANSLL